MKTFNITKYKVLRRWLIQVFKNKSFKWRSFYRNSIHMFTKFTHLFCKSAETKFLNDVHANEDKQKQYYAFRTKLNKTLGFRECSLIIQLAKTNSCVISIVKSNNKGTSNSMLSLLKLGLKENDEIVFSIEGYNIDKTGNKLTHIFAK